MKTTTKLRELIKSKELIVAPGAFSPLCAKMIQKVGFNCVYMSGYGVAAYRLGFPDVGLMTMNESLDTARAIAQACDLPVIADVDNGYGNVINVKRTVEEYELAGVAGIQLEDQSWPKRCGGRCFSRRRSWGGWFLPALWTTTRSGWIKRGCSWR